MAASPVPLDFPREKLHKSLQEIHPRMTIPLKFRKLPSAALTMAPKKWYSGTEHTKQAMNGNSSCFASFREKMAGENLQQADSQGPHELRFERLLPSRRRRLASVTGAKCGSMIRI